MKWLTAAIFFVEAGQIFVSAAPSSAAGAAVSSKKKLKMLFWVPICDKKLNTTSSSTEDDCLSKCTTAPSCQYAAYDSKKKQCGLVMKTDDCSFQRREEQNMILGQDRRSSTTRQNIQYTGTNKLLSTKSGTPVLDGALGAPQDDCKGLCNITPKCKVAYVSSGPHGPQSCSLLANAGPTNKLEMRESMSTAFVFS